MKYFMGIDPGVSGGLACINEKGSIQAIIEMPTNPWDIWQWLGGYNATHIVLEKVASSPQMGVVSAFTFGKGYGTLVGQLTALAHINGTRFEETTPQVWQRALGISPRKKKARRKNLEKLYDYNKRIKGQKVESEPQYKERLRVKAQQLFPKFELWKEPRTMGKQLAICDALLIAEYCRRQK